jgi:hypothetical protein
MQLTSQLSRRLAAGVSVAAAAILLPTAALASSAAAGSSASHTAGGCAASNTRVWYGVPIDHSAGHAHVEFQLSNIGHSTCTFFGYPGVSALNSHGIEVGKPASHAGAKITVTLAPGATAHFVLAITDASAVCGNHAVHATQIRVFPPGQFHAQIVPLATLQCVGRSVMRVDAVHPRAGIPGFSSS